MGECFQRCWNEGPVRHKSVSIDHIGSKNFFPISQWNYTFQADKITSCIICKLLINIAFTQVRLKLEHSLNGSHGSWSFSKEITIHERSLSFVRTMSVDQFHVCHGLQIWVKWNLPAHKLFSNHSNLNIEVVRGPQRYPLLHGVELNIKNLLTLQSSGTKVKPHSLPTWDFLQLSAVNGRKVVWKRFPEPHKGRWYHLISIEWSKRAGHDYPDQ